MALIEIRDLAKYYRMGESVVRALDGVDLTIERGEFVAITGASGSGKSTMMHLLGCLDRPTRGTYRLDTNDVSGLSDRDLAAVRNERIGFVFQTFNLINRTTAWENVAVPLFYARQANTKQPALRALERVGLTTRSTHQPSELSGGERQRVAIARAIVNDPPLLLADEPTGNLDSRTGAQIMEIFQSLSAQGVTIIIVTHEADIAAQTQRVVQMRDGKIVSDQPTAALPAAAGRSGLVVGAPVAGASLADSLEDNHANVDAPVPEFDLPPRRIPGARAGFWLGLSSAGLFGLVIVVQVILLAVYHETLENLQNLQPGDTPKMPPAGMVAGFLAVAGMGLAALVLAILAIVFGRSARKRMKAEIGNWVGGKAALVGQILGWSVIGVTLVGMVTSIVGQMINAPR